MGVRGYEFRVGAPLTGEQVGALAEIPGVASRGRTYLAAKNAAWIVEGLLREWNTSFTVNPQGDLSWLPATARLAVEASVNTGVPLELAALRSWVPEFLTPYQRAGIAAVLGMPGGSGQIWHPAGAGKTLTAIVWALAHRGRIVTVTKAAVRGQWRSEIERFTTITPTVLDGEQGCAIPLEAIWLLVSYDVLPAWITAVEAWAKGLEVPISVIFDESQKVKSHRRWDAIVGEEGKRPKFSLKDNQAAAAMRLSRIAGRRLATTATPIRDRVRDLWAQLDLVHPKEWGPYWTWARRYCAAREGAWGGMNDEGRSNEEELTRRLSFVAHRVKWSEVNRELPPKRRIVTYVRADEQVRAEGMAAELRRAAKIGRAALAEALLHEAAARKRKRVMDLVEEALRSGEKIVVFTGRRLDCARLYAETLKIAPADTVAVTGHGGDSVEARDATREAYMAAPGPAVLIGTSDSWGEGLNLQDTDLLLVVMLPWTPGQVIQLEGRVARLGQKRPVLVHYLVAEGTADERVAGILLGKLPAVERVIESDEVAGMARQFTGADDETLIDAIVGKIEG
jgi:SWI/SNF-related matrix-associated actin-dependent regulator 1 of chromatin subfamily A